MNGTNMDVKLQSQHGLMYKSRVYSIDLFQRTILKAIFKPCLLSFISKESQTSDAKVMKCGQRDVTKFSMLANKIK